jgi:acyl-CoA synthetase (AMP-forming)/AMP-acid ligase II
MLLATSVSSTPEHPVATREQFTSLDEVFRYRAASEPNGWCYSFLREGDGEEQRVTYAEVHARASAVAARISSSVEPGDRVLLVFPPGLEFIYAFLGCLYAGVVAVPVAPPHPRRFTRSVPWLSSLVADSGARVALSTVALRDAAIGEAGLTGLRWVATEDAPVSPGWKGVRRDGSELAFLQYTSGATSFPKAVAVTHANVLANEAMIAEAFESTRECIGVGWLPFHHDMGLIGNVLHPPFAGYPVVLMPPLSVLQRPARWLQAISRFRATVSGGPDFVYDLCARRVADIEGLDLSSWRVAFSGAEAVRGATLDRFSEAFAACGFSRAAFHPCYGLAEATLMVTGGSRQAPVLAEGPSGATRVGCGAPLRDEEIRIVDPDTLQSCPPRVVGEIWVRGPNVARGYWNRPQESAAVFQARAADGSGPWMRTGDLGWRSSSDDDRDGQLFIDGRIKELAIVRGQNHHPQDLELTVENASEAVRPGSVAAFAFETGAGEELAVAAEVDARTAEPHERIAARVRAALVEAHGLTPAAVALLPRGALPRTTSGKLQRRAAAAAFRDGSLQVLAVFRSG